MTNLIVPPSVVMPMPPSALLSAHNLTYTPPRETPLTFFFSLKDLLVRSERRCGMLEEEIISTLRARFRADTPAAQQVDLGDFSPVTPVTNEPYQGCDQPFDRLYPSTEIVDEIKSEIIDQGSDDQVIFAVYLNNSDDPLPDQAARSFEQIFNDLYALPNTRLFLIIIAGNGLSNTPFSSLSLPEVTEQRIPWRAREVTPFDEQMEALSEGLFPFHTVLFSSGMTPIPIPTPRSSDPQEFKICALTPNALQYVSIEGEGTFNAVRTGPQQSYPWGMITPPELYINLLDQKRVTNYDLIKETVILRYEICEAYCDFPFITQSGISYASWSAQTICQREVD